MAEDKKTSPWVTILGLSALGAIGYLLYKKYGVKSAAVTYTPPVSSTSSSSSPTVSAPSYSSSTCSYLQYGSTGSEVLALQKALAYLGDNETSNEDGIFGPITEAAVKKFQSNAGIQVDGIVGPQTGAALNAVLSPKGGKWACGTYQQATTGVSASASSGVGVGYTWSYCPDLQYGSPYHDGVRALQTALTYLGYSTQGIDGYFGPNTEAAVKAFQKAKGLTQDGIAGPETFKALNAALQPHGYWTCQSFTQPTQVTIPEGGGIFATADPGPWSGLVTYNVPWTDTPVSSSASSISYPLFQLGS